MVRGRWNILLLSSCIIVIPTVAVAQTSQNQAHTVCSLNSNESNNNQMTVEGDCNQTNITNIYNGPVYTSVPEQRNGVVEENNLQRPTSIGRMPTEQPVYRISDTQSEGILLEGPEVRRTTPLPGQIVNY